MRRKQLLAAGLSALLVLSQTGTVWGATYADGQQHTIEGDVTEQEDYKTAVSVEGNGTSVTINGNVSATGRSSGGVSVVGSNNSVTVTGNVSATSSSVAGVSVAAVSVVGSNNSVTVKGDANGDILAYGNSNVTVDGTVQTFKSGVTADSSSNVTIGSLESNGTAITAYDNSKVIVKGDVNVGADFVLDINNSIDLLGEAQIQIGGDLSFKQDDSKINLSSAKQKAELLIGGELQNEGKQVALVVAVDENGKVQNLPEIVIGEVEDFENLGTQGIAGYSSELGEYIYQDLQEEERQQVLDSIKYIISSNSDSLDGKGSFQITKVNGDALEKDGSGQYEVAKAKETITVHVDVQNGYEVAELKAGKASVSRNADGSYSVTVPYGGGVNIEAVIREIEIQEQERSRREGRSGTSSFWHQSSVGGWYYIKDTGTRAVCEWLQLDWNGGQNWYYFGEDGQMLTGWQEIDGVWYFLNDQSRAGSPLGCWIPEAVR